MALVEHRSQISVGLSYISDIESEFVWLKTMILLHTFLLLLSRRRCIFIDAHANLTLQFVVTKLPESLVCTLSFENSLLRWLLGQLVELCISLLSQSKALLGQECSENEFFSTHLAMLLFRFKHSLSLLMSLSLSLSLCSATSVCNHVIAYFNISLRQSTVVFCILVSTLDY